MTVRTIGHAAVGDRVDSRARSPPTLSIIL